MSGRLGRPCRFYSATASTNSVALEWATAGAPEGALVVADHQTAGRGRRGRSWLSPPGSSLSFSLVLRPPVDAARLGLLSTALGVACAQAVVSLAGIPARIKWPNDVTVDDRKLGGILGEIVPTERGLAAVVGLGLNVHGSTSALEFRLTLEEVAARSVDRFALLVALLRHLDARREALDDPAGRAVLLDDYRARSGTLGRQVRVELPATAFYGTAVDVTADGHLIVDVGGRRRVLTTGDVVHLRPMTRR